jgi:hypothetical protein
MNILCPHTRTPLLKVSYLELVQNFLLQMEKDYVQYDKHLTACFNQNLKNKKGKEKRKKCEN